MKPSDRAVQLAVEQMEQTIRDAGPMDPAERFKYAQELRKLAEVAGERVTRQIHEYPPRDASASEAAGVADTTEGEGSRA